MTANHQLPLHPHLLPLIALFSLIDYRIQQPGVPSLAIGELLVLYVTAVLFLDSVARPNTYAAVFRYVGSLSASFVLYTMWVVLTAIIALFRSGENIWATRNLVPALVAFTVAAAWSCIKPNINRAFICLSIGGLTNALLGLIQFKRGGPYPNSMHAGALIKMDAAGNIVRDIPTGFFVHPNALAVALIPPAIYLTSTALRQATKRPSTSLVYLIVALPIWVALYFTFAKGPVLWALIGLALALTPTKHLRKATTATLLLSIAVTIALTLLTLDAKLLGLKTLESMKTRGELWHSALSAIATDPYVIIFGNGFQQIYRESLRLSELPYFNAHNNLLNQIIFFGAPALVLHLTLSYTALRNICKTTTQRESHDRENRPVIAGCIIALFFAHYFEPTLDSVSLQIEYFLILGLAYGVGKPLTEEKLHER